MKRLIVFLYLWLTVGFSTGTATLLGPVEWVAAAARAHGWSEGVESAVVRAVIGVFVIASATIAAFITRAVVRTSHAHVRYGVPAIAGLAALAALWLWLSPEVAAGGAVAEHEVSSSFTLGPLPSEQRMAELKRDGYTAVVSLLHPAVVPFETKLIADGRAAAARVGLDYVHVPMLPWVSDNSEALDRIAELSRDGEGRYYVHCYLGKDRVQLARRIIEETGQAGRTARTASGPPPPRLVDGLVFERGEVIEIETGLFLIPYPTDDEMMLYILPGPHSMVVSLLDPANADDAPGSRRNARPSRATDSPSDSCRFPAVTLPRGSRWRSPGKSLRCRDHWWCTHSCHHDRGARPAPRRLKRPTVPSPSGTPERIHCRRRRCSCRARES